MKNQIGIALAIFVIIFGAWFVMFERPARARIDGLRTEINAADHKLETYRVGLNSLGTRSQEYDSLYHAVLSTQASFSGEEEVTALYQLLDSLCHQDSFILDEITPSLEEVIAFFRTWQSSSRRVNLPIRIKIRGEYRPLANLVKTVESSRFYDGIIACSVQGSEELYPNCYLDFAFTAGLNNRLEILDSE